MASKRKLKRAPKPSVSKAAKAARAQVAKAASKQRTLSRKQAATTKKQIAATKRTLKRSSESLLKEYNRLLGEDYDTLAQAKRAFKRETVAVRKSISKRLKKSILSTVKKVVSSVTSHAVKTIHPTPEKPSKQSQPHIDVTRNQKVYSLRDLRDGDKRKVTEYLDDRLNANALDKALLKPGESWAAQVSYTYTGIDGKVHTGYAKTYNIYQSSYALFRRLAGYIENAKISPTQKANWLNQIKIMKFGGTGTEWSAAKKQEKSKSDQRRGKVAKKLAKKGATVPVKKMNKIPKKKG